MDGRYWAEALDTAAIEADKAEISELGTMALGRAGHDLWATLQGRGNGHSGMSRQDLDGLAHG